MTVTTDVGDAHDIHPTKKEPVGQRLALAARALAYGEAIEYSGPLYQSMTAGNGKIILQFKHIGGEDKQFVPAEDVLEWSGMAEDG